VLLTGGGSLGEHAIGAGETTSDGRRVRGSLEDDRSLVGLEGLGISGDEGDGVGLAERNIGSGGPDEVEGDFLAFSKRDVAKDEVTIKDLGVGTVVTAVDRNFNAESILKIMVHVVAHKVDVSDFVVDISNGDGEGASGSLFGLHDTRSDFKGRGLVDLVVEDDSDDTDVRVATLLVEDNITVGGLTRGGRVEGTVTDTKFSNLTVGDIRRELGLVIDVVPGNVTFLINGSVLPTTEGVVRGVKEGDHKILARGLFVADSLSTLFEPFDRDSIFRKGLDGEVGVPRGKVGASDGEGNSALGFQATVRHLIGDQVFTTPVSAKVEAIGSVGDANFDLSIVVDTSLSSETIAVIVIGSEQIGGINRITSEVQLSQRNKLKGGGVVVEVTNAKVKSNVGIDAAFDLKGGINDRGDHVPVNMENVDLPGKTKLDAKGLRRNLESLLFAQIKSDLSSENKILWNFRFAMIEEDKGVRLEASNSIHSKLVINERSLNVNQKRILAFDDDFLPGYRRESDLVGIEKVHNRKGGEVDDHTDGKTDVTHGSFAGVVVVLSHGEDNGHANASKCGRQLRRELAIELRLSSHVKDTERTDKVDVIEKVDDSEDQVSAVRK
jgi:hypothetical protein